MAVEIFTDGTEPDPGAEIWRFLPLWKFEDLIKNAWLYFCRSDLLSDEHEGLPPEAYQQVLGLNPLHIHQARDLDHSLGTLAQFREAFFINCWHLFREETCEMWKRYGADGVAVCSRYELLKMALEKCDGRPHLGLVRYGAAHLTGWNVQRFISTKRTQYAHEREVRAALWILDPVAGMNRHFDAHDRPHRVPLTMPSPERVPEGVTRSVDVQALVTGVVLSPWATTHTVSAVGRLLEQHGYGLSIRPSCLTRYRAWLPHDPPLGRSDAGPVLS